MGVLSHFVEQQVGVVPHVENTGIVEWQGDAMKLRMGDLGYRDGGHLLRAYRWQHACGKF